MSQSLVRVVPDASRIGYGVNVIEQLSPASVQGNSTSVVGMVGAFPWGPVNSLIAVNNVSEALNILAPSAFDESTDTAGYPALLALPLPYAGALRIVRISPEDAAKASIDLASGEVTAITATAKYPGQAGNSIQVEVTASSDSSDAARDIVVSVGNGYSKRYASLDAAGIAAISDPYVDFAGDGLPAIAAAASLTGGNDGTAGATDYTGTISDIVGLQLFNSEDADANILFGAAVPDDLVPDWNAALKAFMLATEKPVFGVLSAASGLSAADVADDVTSYRTDRLAYPWPQVNISDPFATTPRTVQVDGNADFACAISNVLPEVSPGGANGVPWLRRILSLEGTAPSRATLDTLKAAGIAAFSMARELDGAIIRGGVTTNLDPRLTTIWRRRMTDYIALSIARALAQYAERPLDLTFNAQGKVVALGFYTGAEVGIVTAFLEGLKAAERIAGYSVDAVSGNSPTTAAANEFYITIVVTLFGSQEKIVLTHKVSAGENTSV